MNWHPRRSSFHHVTRDKDRNKSSVNTVWHCLWIDPSVSSVLTSANSLLSKSRSEAALMIAADDRFQHFVGNSLERSADFVVKIATLFLMLFWVFFCWIIKALSLTVCVAVCVITGICAVKHLSLQWRGLQGGQGRGSVYQRLLHRARGVSRCWSTELGRKWKAQHPMQHKNVVGVVAFHTWPKRPTHALINIHSL